MEREFTSKLEELIKAKELIFPATPAFGDYKHLFPEEARSHPAKMNTKLLEWLILTFTEEGDVVLDPMAGTYSTCIIASLHGRHGIGVDIEEEFYRWGLEAKKKIEETETITPKGRIIVLKGDARKLSELLRGVGIILTSPPYAETQAFQDIEFMKRTSKEQSEKVRGGEIKRHYMTEEARITVFERIEKGKIENPENIGPLPFGNISTIITSPPYSSSAIQDYSSSNKVLLEFERKVRESFRTKGYYEYKGKRYTEEEWRKINKGELKPRGIPELWAEIISHREKERYNDENPDNIANLPHGNIDTIITGSPYTEANRGGGIAVKGYEGKYDRDEKPHLSHDRPLSDSPDNTSNMSYVDSIITSPPYLDVDNVKLNSEKFWQKAKESGKRWGSKPPIGTDQKYMSSQENISNLPFGDVDAVITSPPYAHESTASKPTNLEKQGLFKIGHSKERPYTEEDYRTWSKHKDGNIGKRKLFVRVPCSPEEAQFHDTREGRKGTIWEYTKEVEATLEVIEQIQKLKSEKKGKSETYLEAMLKVYSEMFKVLKPGGKAIIVVKPFIHNKKVVDLPWHTWLLMERVGFKLREVYKFRLPSKSFWRILYEKRFPEVPRIMHEYIIVAEKPTT